MNSKNVATYLRRSFSRRKKTDTSFFGLFSQKNWYLMIRSDLFDEAVDHAIRSAERDEADIREVTASYLPPKYTTPPKYVRVPKYTQPELPLEKPVRQLELPNPDVVNALMNLGYKKREVLSVVSDLRGDVETQIIEALRRLGK